MSVVRQSKFRHVFGTAMKPEFTYQNLRINLLAYESINHIAANSTYFAVPYQPAGGGSVYVGSYDNPGKADINSPVVSGHKGAVVDVAFNPFNDSLLTTAAEDCHVRLFGIPEGGLKDHIESPLVCLEGHGRKVHGLQYHPYASNVLLSVGYDHSMKIWDVEKAECKVSIDDHPDLIQGISWAYDGNTIGTTCKDKTARLVDSRAGKVTATVKAHEGAKGARCQFLGRTGLFFTVGTSKMSERQYMVWDPRKFTEPLITEGMDVSTSTYMPFYDDDVRMLYLAGKGEVSIKYFEVVDEHPYVHFLSQFQDTTPQNGVTFLPKGSVDVGACEVARALRITKTVVTPVQFRVPRKSDQFQEDIFPDSLDPEPVQTADEFFAGKIATPKYSSMKPGESKRKSTAGASTFKAVRPAAELQKDLDAANSTIEKQAAKIAELEAKLAKMG